MDLQPMRQRFRQMGLPVSDPQYALGREVRLPGDLNGEGFIVGIQYAVSQRCWKYSVHVAGAGTFEVREDQIELYEQVRSGPLHAEYRPADYPDVSTRIVIQREGDDYTLTQVEVPGIPESLANQIRQTVHEELDETTIVRFLYNNDVISREDAVNALSESVETIEDLIGPSADTVEYGDDLVNPPIQDGGHQSTRSTTDRPGDTDETDIDPELSREIQSFMSHFDQTQESIGTILPAEMVPHIAGILVYARACQSDGDPDETSWSQWDLIRLNVDSSNGSRQITIADGNWQIYTMDDYDEDRGQFSKDGYHLQIRGTE
jgi:hypothetical protein